MSAYVASGGLQLRMSWLSSKVEAGRARQPTQTRCDVMTMRSGAGRAKGGTRTMTRILIIGDCWRPATPFLPFESCTQHKGRGERDPLVALARDTNESRHDWISRERLR